MSDEKKPLSKVVIPTTGPSVTVNHFRPTGGSLSCWWPDEGPHRLLVRAVYEDGSNKIWEYLPNIINGPVERCYA